MNKNEKKLLFVAFVMSLIIAIAFLWTPQVEYNYEKNSFEVLQTLAAKDIDVTNNCVIDENGKLTILNGDPHIVFLDLSDTGQMAVINFVQPLTEATEMEIFFDSGWGFSEAQKLIVPVQKGDSTAEVLLPVSEYVAFRLDVDVEYQLENIQLGNVSLISENVSNHNYVLLWATLFACLIVIVVHYIERNVGITERIIVIWSSLKENFKKKILWLIGIGAISVVISIIWKGIPHREIYSLYVFLISTAFVFFVLCVAAYLWCQRKNILENFEKHFARLMLITGCAMILFTPLAHASWDTESHYRMALETSYLGDVHLTQADRLVINVAADTLLKNDGRANFQNMGILTLASDNIIESYNANVSLAHLPSALFLALGRLVHLPFIFNFMFGKLGGLLCYTMLCYFAMKKLKTGKFLLAVIALLPTNIFLACNYSYDYWVTGFSILGIAYFVGELQNYDQKVSAQSSIVMNMSLGLACIPKSIYFPMLCLPFLMPKRKLENRKKYYGICILALVVVVAVFLKVALTETGGTGDLRGGSGIDPSGQLEYIFSDIINYAWILVRFLFAEYFTITNLPNAFSNYAYIGVAGTTCIAFLLIILMLLFDREEKYSKENKSGWLTRIFVILLFVGGSALAATSMYIAFTPVGYQTVLGCQARYMLPLLYPMLAVWSINRIKPIISRNILGWMVFLGSFGIIIFDIYNVFLPKLI